MNLFGDSDYLEKLSLKGDPLERLEKAMISCKKCTKSLFNMGILSFYFVIGMGINQCTSYTFVIFE